MSVGPFSYPEYEYLFIYAFQSMIFFADFQKGALDRFGQNSQAVLTTTGLNGLKVLSE